MRAYVRAYVFAKTHRKHQQKPRKSAKKCWQKRYVYRHFHAMPFQYPRVLRIRRLSTFTLTTTYVTLRSYCLCTPMLCSSFPFCPFIDVLLFILVFSSFHLFPFFAMPCLSILLLICTVRTMLCCAVLYCTILYRMVLAKTQSWKTHSTRKECATFLSVVSLSFWYQWYMRSESLTKLTVCNVNNIMVGPLCMLFLIFLRLMVSSFFNSPIQKINYSKCLHIDIFMYTMHR